MQTFSMFFSEDAGEKFRNMSDDQFSGWKKANPGAAQKADELRSGKKAPTTAAPKAAPGKNLPGDKPGGPLSAKGGALAKHRKSEMGKWAEGSKKSPSALAKKASSAVTKKDPIKPVDVKVDAPKKPAPTPAKGNVSTPVADRTYLPLKKKETPQQPQQKAKKKKSKSDLLGKAIRATRAAARNSTDDMGVSTSGDLEGLSGRDKGLGN